MRCELREGPQLRRLLSQQTAVAVEVDIGLGMELVAVEDDELSVDTARAQCLDVRPRDAGGVDGTVRDAHGVTLA